MLVVTTFDLPLFVFFLFKKQSKQTEEEDNICVLGKRRQDKGNQEVIEKLREFGVGSFAASRKAVGSKDGGNKGGGKKGYDYYSSSDYDSDDYRYERDRRRRKWAERKRRRSSKSRGRSRSGGRSGKYDDVSISTITGLPRDCSPPVRRAEKSDSPGTVVSD